MHFLDFLGPNWSVPFFTDNEFARVFAVSVNSLEITSCRVKERIVFRVIVLLDTAEVIELISFIVTWPVAKLIFLSLESLSN